MSQITLISSYSKNSDLVISAQEIRRNYLYGITINSPFANKINLNFSDEDIEFHIRDAQKQVENYLAVKLKRQIYTETLPFNNTEWQNWGFIKTNYMVVYPLKLQGYLNTTLQTTYPSEWLTSKQESGDELYHRTIHIVPAGNTGAIVNSIIYTGLLPNLGYINAGKIPDYWKVQYVTGFATVPYDIIAAIAQLTTISMLLIAGANILGMPGLASSSLSIDGLSQSLTSSLNAYGQRVQQYSQDLQRKLPNMRDTYRGFSWSVA